MSGYYKFRDGGDLVGETQIHFSHLDSISDPKGPPGADVVYIHNMLSGGDYGNDALISRANVNSFREAISDEWLGQLFFPVIGNHGSFAIAVLGDVMFKDSALYEANDNEEMVDAANSIREMVEGLDSYPLINDEEHSNLEQEEQTLQFPAACMDVYRRDVQGRSTLPGWIAEVLAVDAPKAAARLAEDTDGHLAGSLLAGLQSFYFELGGELYGVYPYAEGGGDNVSIVFNFDDLMKRFTASMQALRALSSGAAATLAELIVKSLFDEKPWEHFKYGGQIYAMLHEGYEISRMSADEFAALEDACEMNPPKARELAEKGQLLAGVKAGAFDGALVGFAELEGVRIEVVFHPGQFTSQYEATAFRGDRVVGNVQGLVDGDTIDPEGSTVEENERGRGIAVALYQALYVRACQDGIKTVSGHGHTHAAGRVHEALQRRYGYAYDPGHDSDTERGGYSYSIADACKHG